MFSYVWSGRLFDPLDWPAEYINRSNVSGRLYMVVPVAWGSVIHLSLVCEVEGCISQTK